jgi:hypothetical protein
MLLKSLAAAAVLIGAPAALAQHFSPRPTDWPGCRLRHRVTTLSRLEDMPASIQADFRQRVGQVAAPDEAFNPGDVSYVGDPTPERRFLRGVQSGDYWFIWYEHGGFAFHRHVLAYSIRIDGSAYLSGEPHRAQPGDRVETTLEANLTGDPCIATDAFLSGVYPGTEF